MKRKRNPDADDYSVLLDAIEEQDGKVIVPLFERFYGGPPTATSLYDLATHAVAANRMVTAEDLFDQGRAMNRWEPVPLELQAFVPFDGGVVMEELAHVLEAPRKRFGRATPVGAAIRVSDRTMRTFDPSAILVRWHVYKNEDAALKEARKRGWEDAVREARDTGDPYVARHVIKRRVEDYIKRAGLGEVLGIAPRQRGMRTPSGFLVFDEYPGREQDAS